MSPSQASHKPSVLILTPVYNEQGSLPDYVRRVREELFTQPDCDYRVLFIDDGSADASWKLIQECCAGDARFSALRLSRNFGPHAALNAGLTEGRADAFVILACDLQDPPSAVIQMVAKWRAGAEIVWGKRRNRSDGFMRKLLSRMFYELLKRQAMPRNSKFATGSFLLASNKVVECYRQFQEHSRITFALVAWTGFEQDVVDYDREGRKHGCSGWSFARMLKAMFDALVGFSGLLINIMTWAGAALSGFSLLLSLYLVFSWLNQGTRMPGWPSLMLGLTFFFGVQFFFMGIMGEYLSRIYLESVRRPAYFVSTRITSDPQQTDCGTASGQPSQLDEAR